MSGQRIEYTANGGKANGYLSRPDGGGNGKGIIVIQEWWGLVPHIEDVTDRFAKLGYVALAPDLWDGKKAANQDEAGRLYMALNIDDVAKKRRGAASALREHGASGKVGVIGFCMGGILAIYAAGAQPDDIGAAIDFYGGHPNVTPESGRKMKQAIEAAGGSVELHVYPAGHAFFNDSRPEVHDPASSADAWQKVQDFLARSL